MFELNEVLFFFEVFHVLQDFGIEEGVGVDAPQVVEVVPVVERHQEVGHQVRQHGRQSQNVLKLVLSLV